MSVTAIIVAADLRHLPQTLAAVGEQTSRPERTILVDVTGLGEGLTRLLQQLGSDIPVEVHEALGAKNLGIAVNDLLRHGEIDSEWLWLLHDDSPPEPEALAELVKATATARTVGIAGCKQVDIDDPARLLSVGVKHTRSARRVTQIEFGEIDQGQYDDREDIYAVGTAGMFIRRATWVALEGPDPRLGPFLDGAELSRRARLAGERVVIVPTAVVRHARTSLWHGPDRAHTEARGAHSFLPRRVATLHFRLITANAWTVPLVLLSMFAGAIGRALWRISTNDIRMSWQELRAVVIVLAGLGGVYRSRRAIARATSTNRRVLAPLYATRVDVVRAWWHSWRATRVARRRKSAPSELEIAEKRVITRRRRVMHGAVGIVTLILAGLLLPRVSAGSILDLPALTGGALGGVDQDHRVLWERAVSGWSAAGDGAPAALHPFGFVLAALATLTGGPLGVPAHVSTNLLLLLAVPLAGLTGWYAAGGLTRSALLRAFAALSWAFVPASTVAINHGRIGAILAHVLLPLFALALARTIGVDRRDVIRSGMDDAGAGGATRWVLGDSTASGLPSIGAAAAAGVILAVIGASAPILLPALLVLVGGVTLCARGRRPRMAIVVLPVLMMFIPTLAAAPRNGWSSVLQSIDSAPVNLTVFESLDAGGLDLVPWYTLLGMPDRPAGFTVAAGVAGALLLLAVIGLLRGGTAGRAARVGVAVAALGVLTAVLADHVLRSPQYDWLGSFQRLPEWAGPGASLAAGGVVVAAVAGVKGLGARAARRSVGAPHLGAGIAALLLLGVVGAGAVNTAEGLLEEPQWQARGTEPLPALARQTVAGEGKSRVLMVAPTENAIVVQSWRGNGTQLLDPHVLGDDDASAELMTLAAELMAGSAEEIGRTLADHAVAFVLTPNLQSSYVAIDRLSREELLAALDGQPDLERVTDSDVGTMWRVKATATRVRIVQGEQVTPLPSGTISVDTRLPELPSREAGQLVLAERVDPGWRATLDGERLRRLDDQWYQAFELPADAAGDLMITHEPLLHRLWQVAAATLFFFVIVLALPIRRRPEVDR